MACETQKKEVELAQEAVDNADPGPQKAQAVIRLRNAKAALETCLHPPPPPPPPPPATPVPLTLTLTKFVCLDANDPGPFENDEPYAVVFAVDLKIVGPVPTGMANSKMTLVGPLGGVSEGDTVAAPANVIWGLSNAPDFVSSADNLIVIVVMMENDSGSPDQVRTLLEKSAQLAVVTNAPLFASGAIPRQELVNRIIANVAGTLPAAKVAIPDPDDNIGPPQELRFVRGELDDIYRNKDGGAIELGLDFAGDDSRYRLFLGCSGDSLRARFKTLSAAL